MRAEHVSYSCMHACTEVNWLYIQGEGGYVSRHAQLHVRGKLEGRTNQNIRPNPALSKFSSMTCYFFSSVHACMYVCMLLVCAS